jgi:hypothetical protein
MRIKFINMLVRIHIIFEQKVVNKQKAYRSDRINE